MRLLSLYAALLAIVTMLACNSDEEAGIDSPSPGGSPASSASPPSDAPTTVDASPAPTGQTYRNEKYGWEVTLPPGWRVATGYMETFAEKTSYPGYVASPEDYVVLTSLNTAEEGAFLEQAAIPRVSLTGLEPLLEFRFYSTVEIVPAGATLDTHTSHIIDGNVTRENTGIRPVTLDSGGTATRFIRREIDDRGDYTFDTAYIPFQFQPCPPDQGDVCNGVVVRVTTKGMTSMEDPMLPSPTVNSGAPVGAFEAIFRSFQDVGS